jgi:DNA-binding response OmpR family regulator
VVNSERQGGAALRVLVVEDDADTARTWVWLLQAMGHEVEIARDGPTALRAAEGNPPDAVLLDLGLPGLSGHEVAERLRRQQTGAARPLIIAVTGFGEYPQRLRSYEVGIDLHLVKPVNPDELKGFLERYQKAYHPGK